jgi:hypothetical protein
MFYTYLDFLADKATVEHPAFKYFEYKMFLNIMYKFNLYLILNNVSFLSREKLTTVLT